MRLQKYSSALLFFVMALFFAASTSCDLIHEDLEPCPQGFRLRFVYDYNLEFADGFSKQVDCLTVMVFDKEGRYVTTQTAGKDDTFNPDWRMELKLPAGDYQLLAYGGMECELKSFDFVSDPKALNISEVQVKMKDEFLTSPEGRDLHPLFYGRLSATVPAVQPGTTYVEETVYMMKDTNDLRIVLANESMLPTHGEDFIFEITDHNTLFNSDNKVISTENVTFYPWDKGTISLGEISDNETFDVAYADFGLSRLIDRSGANLKITRVSDGVSVLDVPLINFLLLYKAKNKKWEAMPNQEFLDRESRWSLMFFLTDSGQWLQTKIMVNDWEVRINDVADL